MLQIITACHVQNKEDDLDEDIQVSLPKQQKIKHVLSPECPDNIWKKFRQAPS